MRRLIAASLTLAVFVVPTSALATFGRTPVTSHYHWCAKTFRVSEVVRKIRHTYSGTRDVTHRERHQIAGQEHCLRNPIRTGYVLRVNRDAKRAWAARRNPWHSAFVSQYDDSGQTASGWHATYGVAVCGSGGGPCLPMGTRIEFSYGGSHAVGVVDDHGPYISGREFDLSDNLANALGFGGLGTVGWRVVR